MPAAKRPAKGKGAPPPGGTTLPANLRLLTPTQVEYYYGLPAGFVIKLAKKKRILYKFEEGRWLFAPEWIEKYVTTPGPHPPKSAFKKPQQKRRAAT